MDDAQDNVSCVAPSACSCSAAKAAAKAAADSAGAVVDAAAAAAAAAQDEQAVAPLSAPPFLRACSARVYS